MKKAQKQQAEKLIRQMQEAQDHEFYAFKTSPTSGNTEVGLALNLIDVNLPPMGQFIVRWRQFVFLYDRIAVCGDKIHCHCIVINRITQYFLV